MPKLLPWILVGTFDTKDALDATLSAYRHTLKINKSQLAPCTVCAENNIHNMRTIIKYCESSRCKESEQKCSFQVKIVKCVDLNTSELYEIGTHSYIAEERSPKKCKIEGQVRSYIEDRIIYGKIPTQVHADVTSNRATLGLLINEIPSLKQVQGFMRCYRSNNTNENDRIDTLITLLDDKSIDKQIDDSSPFYFGVEVDENGKPLVTDGSDSQPFFLGLSTRRLLRNVQIASDSGPVLLHADATFKLNQTSYPLLAFGVSDSTETFHLVCLVLTSHRTTCTWKKALMEIRSAYVNIIGSEMRVDFVMGDADDAQHNAFMEVFPNNIYLMCYFHGVKNVREKCRGLSSKDYATIMEDINLLHYASDSTSFTSLKDVVLRRWAENDLSTLKEYVDKNWIKSSFHRWQAFWTPCGFTTANNPIEQFNSTIKQTWTCRTKLKVPVLITKLFELLEYHSVHVKIFHQNNAPTADLLKRMTSLRFIGLLKENACEPNISSTIYQGEEQNADTDLQPPLESEKYAEQLVSSTISYFARWVEFKDMPIEGWVVSLEEKTCPCLYFTKFGSCVHLLFALSQYNLPIPGLPAPPRTFVNRTVSRGRGHSQGRGRGRDRCGRPRSVGSALQMT